MPILNRIFTGTVKDSTQNEILFSITPHLVRSPKIVEEDLRGDGHRHPGDPPRAEQRRTPSSGSPSRRPRRLRCAGSPAPPAGPAIGRPAGHRLPGASGRGGRDHAGRHAAPGAVHGAHAAAARRAGGGADAGPPCRSCRSRRHRPTASPASRRWRPRRRRRRSPGRRPRTRRRRPSSPPPRPASPAPLVGAAPANGRPGAATMGAASPRPVATRPATASLSPAEARTTVGGTATVTVVAMGAQDLTEVQLVVAYDPAVVEATGVAAGLAPDPRRRGGRGRARHRGRARPRALHAPQRHGRLGRRGVPHLPRPARRVRPAARRVHDPHLRRRGAAGRGRGRHDRGVAVTGRRWAAVALVAVLLACEGAYLTAPPGSTLVLIAKPNSIPAHGGVSELTAIVTEAIGTAVPDGTVVFWSTNLGQIDRETRTANGIARNRLVSDSRSGVATVVAVSGGGTAPGPDPGARRPSAGTPTPTRRRPRPAPGAQRAGVGHGNGSTSATSSSANVLLRAVPSRITISQSTHLIATVLDAGGQPGAQRARLLRDRLRPRPGLPRERRRGRPHQQQRRGGGRPPHPADRPRRSPDPGAGGRRVPGRVRHVSPTIEIPFL